MVPTDYLRTDCVPVSFLVSYIFVYRGSSKAAHRPLSRHRDGYGEFWTAILNPEKRKVGGSTPPLTTTLTSGNAAHAVSS